jgi:polyphosphate kinase
MPKKSRPKPLGKSKYKRLVEGLQIELVKLHKDVIREGRRIVVVVEGRDAAGKDGLIKALTEHMSPREVRVVALPKPSDRERAQWYFQRFVAHLPCDGEIVVFNRSWYNRAGVERVMGFCTEDDVEEFYDGVNPFEGMLARARLEIVKYYLDVSRGEQRERLRDRRADPLTQWKVSPIDAAAQKRWGEYSAARDEMLRRTNTPVAPWIVVRADDKRTARVAMMSDLLKRLRYRGRRKDLTEPDERAVFAYGPSTGEKLER